VVEAVTAVVLPSEVVLPELPLAGLASTNCVRADSNALNSVPPCVDPLVPLVVLPESALSSPCRPREARRVPSTEARLTVLLLLFVTALVDIMHSLV
jgi:hypothetical protein